MSDETSLDDVLDNPIARQLIPLTADVLANLPNVPLPLRLLLGPGLSFAYAYRDAPEGQKILRATSQVGGGVLGSLAGALAHKPMSSYFDPAARRELRGPSTLAGRAALFAANRDAQTLLSVAGSVGGRRLGNALADVLTSGRDTLPMTAYDAGKTAALEKLGADKTAFWGAIGRGLSAAGRGLMRYFSGNAVPRYTAAAAPRFIPLAETAAAEAGQAAASAVPKTLMQRFAENKGSMALNAGFGLLSGETMGERVQNGAVMGVGGAFGMPGMLASSALTQFLARPPEPPGPQY